jgi:hypothetical protein
VVLSRRIRVFYPARQDGLAAALVGFPEDTAPRPAFTGLKIATLPNAFLPFRLKAVVDSGVARRVATAIVRKVTFHCSAVLHGSRESHVRLQKEQALVIHGLCYHCTVRAIFSAEPLRIRLPERTGGILHAPLAELLAS